MNYKIIFCLLFALINSKKEFHPLFGKTMTNNLSNKIYSSDYLGGIKKYCVEDYTKDQCLATIIPGSNYQCCYEIIKSDFGNPEKCSKYPKDLELYQKLSKSSKYKACLKEYYGHRKYKKYLPERTKMNINCNNGEFTINFGYDTYTENEQNILKNENHCLNKKSLKEKDFNYDVGKCEEGLLINSSKSLGLECGYFLYNIKINSEISLTYKTCDIFNLDMYSTILKIDPYYFDRQVASITYELSYTDFESYNAEIYDIKGNTIKYDFITQKIIIDGPEDEPAPNPEFNPNDIQSIGYTLTFSKYLFILILILF